MNPGRQANPAILRHAIAIVLLEAGRMLVIRRAAGVRRPGFWSPPTGWIEAGESAAEAVQREASEELGLVVRADCEIWHCMAEVDGGPLRIGWWLTQRLGGELQAEPSEVSEHRFVDAEAYFQLTPTFTQHHEFFREVLPQLLASAQA